MDVTPGDKENYICSYLVESQESNFIIETGPSSSVEKLLVRLDELGFALRDIDFVVVTHIHLDHGGGAGDLVRLERSLKVYVHPRGYLHLNDPSKLWKASRNTLGRVAEIYGEPKPIPSENLISVPDGFELDLGDAVLKFIHTPGHASHHMVVYLDGLGAMFTGDAAGINIDGHIIPITPAPHNPIKAINSLKRLLDYNPARLCFTHFGVYEGLDYLKKALDKWIWWTEFIGGLYRRGVDVREAYRRVLESDPDSRFMEGFYNKLGFGDDEILIGVRGMYSYFEWIGEGNG